MDIALSLLLDGFWLAIMLSLPGTLILIQVKTPPRDLGKLLVYGAGISVLFVVLASAVLLHLGRFSIENLSVAVLLPAPSAAVNWRKAWTHIKAIRLSRPAFLATTAVGLLFFLMLMVTPLWNFLVAPNMDAGNYELYGNHFWTTGSFYLDESLLIESGASPKWVESHNTWNVDSETSIARPSYLPGYPVLLGVFKANFATALASPAANALLIGLVGMVMVKAGLRVLRAPLVIASLTVVILMTPIVFFYGKQLMSEAMGIFGVLFVVLGILETRAYMERRGESDAPATSALILAVGLSIGLLSRLDFYLLLPLLIIGTGLVIVESVGSGGRCLSKSFYLIPAISIVASTSVVAFLGEPSYLRHGQPSFLNGFVTPSLYIVLFGLANGLAFLAIGGLQVLVANRERPRRRLAWLRFLDWSYAGAAVVWVLYVIWSLYIRPFEDGGPADHDPENLVRLFTVTSPVILGLLLLFIPLVLLDKRSERGVVLGLAVGLCIVLYASRHSPLEVWWMRRYVQYFVPLALLVLGGVMARRPQVRSTGNRRIRSVTVGLLLVLTLAQTWSLRYMMTAEVNRDVPTRLAQMMRVIPEEAFVVVIEGNSMVRGLANTYRSLGGNKVLVDVAIEDLPRAASLAPSEVPVIVVTPATLDKPLVDALQLMRTPFEASIERQWVDRLEEFREDVDDAESATYFVYMPSSWVVP